MSFIEGIGDEVTLSFVILVAFVIAALVTFINNRPQFLTRPRVNASRSSEQESDVVQQGPSIVFVCSRRVNGSTGTQHEFSSTTENENNTNNNDIQNNANGVPTSDSNEGATGENDDTSPDDTEEQRTSSDTATSSDSTKPEETTGSNSATEETETSTVLNGDVQELNPEASAAEKRHNNMPENLRPGEIRVRLKYLDDTEKTVTTTLETKIGDFKKSHFSEDLRNNKIVRLIFAGRLLHNSSTIQNCRIVDNAVVHVQVLAAPVQPPPSAAQQDSDIHVGRMLLPVITVIIGLCWMAYFKYPEYFNTLSLGLLLLFSGCFFYVLSQIQQQTLQQR